MPSEQLIEDTTPIFNMGIAYLMRIDFLQRKMNDFSIMGEMQSWYRTIKTLRRELSPVMNEKEKKDYEKKISECAEETVNSYKKKLSYKENKLEEVDMLLRTVIDRQKWINPKSDDPRYAVLG